MRCMHVMSSHGQITDTHLGYLDRQSDFDSIEGITRMLEMEHPDLVLLTGDIISAYYSTIPFHHMIVMTCLLCPVGVYGLFVGGVRTRTRRTNQTVRDRILVYLPVMYAGDQFHSAAVDRTYTLNISP